MTKEQTTLTEPQEMLARRLTLILAAATGEDPLSPDQYHRALEKFSVLLTHIPDAAEPLTAVVAPLQSVIGEGHDALRTHLFERRSQLKGFTAELLKFGGQLSEQDAETGAAITEVAQRISDSVEQNSKFSSRVDSKSVSSISVRRPRESDMVVTGATSSDPDKNFRR